ncbi:hypothetical protein [Streptomyces sp. SID13031]|uniref:hypothetical protein n=1 Tax=Streptomyces sp. SID13031 TaxID=2706046 RepID=UPI0013C58FEF|nr:hypothetical protein [Streptomyces sp. SID13031]NEA33805.1 hypothetical protein [Streptomyces sp. SID13031]
MPKFIHWRRGKLIAAAAIALATLTVPAQAATVEPATPRAAVIENSAIGPMACVPDNAGATTSRFGNEIRGVAGLFNCSGGVYYVTVTLQWHRWFGWSDLSSWTGYLQPGELKRLYYNCSGTGTYTYRTYISGRTAGGDPWFRESNQITENC